MIGYDWSYVSEVYYHALIFIGIVGSYCAVVWTYLQVQKWLRERREASNRIHMKVLMNRLYGHKVESK
jgi:hypothetical protein